MISNTHITLPETTDGSEAPDRPKARPAARRVRRRRGLIVGLLALGLAAGAVVAANVLVSGQGDDPNGDATASRATAVVERRDLVVTEDLDGELGFGEPATLAAGAAGIVTSLPEAGTVVSPGDALYSVGLEPAVLLPGAVPAYRALDTDATDGPDIEQLQQGLVDLGVDEDLTVDGEFGASTADAVEAWEEELGRDDPDGTVELGEVVFGPASVRVAELQVDTGAQVQPGAPVLTYTAESRVVTVDLDANRTDLLPLDTQVEITLPDGAETSGTVTSVGTEAEADPADPDAQPTVPVEITIDDQAAAEAFDTGEVTVTVEQSRDEDVLAVPVTALLALTEGGYALEVTDPAAPDGGRLVAVDIGTYTNDYVGVSGEGIEEGVEVVVPE